MTLFHKKALDCSIGIKEVLKQTKVYNYRNLRLGAIGALIAALRIRFYGRHLAGDILVFPLRFRMQENSILM